MGELDQVAGRVAAEEARAVGDRSVVVWLVARVVQAPPNLVQVLHLETEVSSRSGIGLTAKEMQLEAVPGGEQNQLQLAQGGRGRQLAQSQALDVEGAQGGLASGGERRRNMLQAADFHAHVRG